MTAQVSQDCRYCPNPSRVAAYSGAIAVHALAFAFLLIPISYREMAKVAKPIPPPNVVARLIPKENTVPPIPLPPTREKPKTDVIHAAPLLPKSTTADRVQPPTTIPDKFETTELPPVNPPPNGGTVTSVAAPVTVSYISAPLLYPPTLVRRGLEGVVMLRVLVDQQGIPAKIELDRSSGHPELDRAALSQVTKWRFNPAVKDGETIEVWALIPVKFSLLTR